MTAQIHAHAAALNAAGVPVTTTYLAQLQADALEEHGDQFAREWDAFVAGAEAEADRFERRVAK